VPDSEQENDTMLCLLRLGVIVASWRLIAAWLVVTFSVIAHSALPEPDEREAALIGELIFANECNLNAECLTSWNIGEDFPSLGIGHFIWYREGQDERFRESFPALLAFYDQQGMTVPAWIDRLPGRAAPWQDRDEFLDELDGWRLRELRQFLIDTKDIQAQFIIQRLYDGVPGIVAAANDPDAVSAMFARIAAAERPLGMYALIDYVNFKGEGILESERYQDQGWGLLQVIEHMLETPSDAPVMRRFADASAAVLRQRVENAPPDRNEQRWLQGWYNRTETYATLPSR